MITQRWRRRISVIRSDGAFCIESAKITWLTRWLLFCDCDGGLDELFIGHFLDGSDG
jgi:hypothetical protein